MADVFISYKREDRELIKPLAQALEGRGYTVWWDLELVPSQKFERQIKSELDAARCVIVVWTRASVGDDGMYVSEWVQIEANSGDQRGILLPVQFDAGRTHWRHGQSQFAVLHGWAGDESAQAFNDLLKGVTLHAGVRAPPLDRELAAYQDAERAESADAFRKFLTDFPSSRFADLARGRAAELEEIAAWSALGPAPTIIALAGFLRRYPAGRFADDAEARIKALELAGARGQRASARPAPNPQRAAQFGPSPGGAAFDMRWVFGAGAAAVLLVALLAWSPWNGSRAIATDTEVAATEAPPADATAPAEAVATLRDGQTFRDCADCPEMVVIPAGSFTMGSPASETGRSSDEGPQRRVAIARFAAGKYEVTRGQYAAFVQATNRADPQVTGNTYCTWRNPGYAQNDSHPVACLNWQDARDYAAWLSQRTRQDYRLLTEAEWEYAARGGDRGGAYWWGATASHEYANYGTDQCCSGLASGRDQWVNTAPVGQFPANAFGLHDMHGNLWEWGQDCYANSYANAPTIGSSAPETANCSRVLRGGSWLDYPNWLRSADRNGLNPTIRNDYIGFRLARTL